jgi:hypothetical protein
MARTSAYTDFVRKQYPAMRKKHARPQDRIAEIAKMWRAHKNGAPATKTKTARRSRRTKKKSHGDGEEDSS